MKPFDKLTGAGKLRRLRQVVIHAMTNYDIEIERVRLLVVETNMMFLVRSKSGEKFVLRIYSDDDTTL